MTRTHRHIASAIALSSAAALALGAAPARAGEAGATPFLAALAEFERGLAGDSGANERAGAMFQKLADAEPQNPLYVAYLGSTFAIQGREAWAPWNKIRHTEKGLGLLDKALALLTPAHDQETSRGIPVSAEVRLNAASTFLAVPGFMNRTEPARLVIGDALASPAFAATPAPLQARLLTQAALLAKRDQKPAQEAEALRKALAAAPDAPAAAQVRARLEELREEQGK